ncbi:MAG: nitroreductase family protein [Williamsia sp.]|nr:nitroreductase family protein [Williamsia sp.]
MELINALNWRYAAKRMNGRPVPAEQLNNILEATRLSASSMGLQPYKVLVIEDEEVRKKIQKVAFNQAPIVEGSHLLVFAAYANVTEEHIQEYINHISTVRGVPVETLEGFKASMMRLASRTPEQNYQWAARQTYIAFGTAIAAAAEERVDATPMEGFDPEALDELLSLKEKGLRSVTLLALGYRDSEKDVLANALKVRKGVDELFMKVA